MASVRSRPMRGGAVSTSVLRSMQLGRRCSPLVHPRRLLLSCSEPWRRPLRTRRASRMIFGRRPLGRRAGASFGSSDQRRRREHAAPHGTLSAMRATTHVEGKPIGSSRRDRRLGACWLTTMVTSGSKTMSRGRCPAPTSIVGGLKAGVFSRASRCVGVEARAGGGVGLRPSGLSPCR
jgi:hypothetical protein